MFVLMLNDMRSSNIEITSPVLKGSSKKSIITYLERERVPAYRDGRWYKTFRQGSMLEWCNQPDDRSFVDVGTRETWAARAAAQFDQQINGLPEAL